MPTSTTEIMPMPLTMSPGTDISSGREVIGKVMRRARKTDWDNVIARTDRAVSIGGAAVVILALLYFAPIFVNMLTR